MSEHDDGNGKEFPGWCAVWFPDGENLWGRVRAADWPGGAMLCLEVPDDEGGIARRQYHATAAVARIVPTTEREARAAMTERRQDCKQVAEERQAGFM